MKRNWLLVPALAVCFASGLGTARAAEIAPAAKPEKKLTKLQQAGKLTPAAKAKLEELAGKPLTAEQEKALVDEDIAYRAALEELNAAHTAKQAAAMGMTVDQFNAAQDAARKKAMDERKAKAAGAAPAAAPAAPAQ